VEKVLDAELARAIYEDFAPYFAWLEERGSKPSEP